MTQKKKICHITTVHSPFDVRIFHRECKTLVSYGYKVTLVAPHTRDEISDGVYIRSIAKNSNKIKRFLFTIWQAYFKALKENAIIYHFHDPELIPIGLLLKILHKKIVIYDVHEHYSEIITQRLPKFLQNSLVKWFLKFILEKVPTKFFDLLVFPTSSLMYEYNTTSKGIILINLPSKYDCHTSTFPWKEKMYDIVFVGTISPPRMRFLVEVATELAKFIPKFKWLLVGIPNSTIIWMFKNYDRYFLEDYFTFVPRVPFNEVLEYLKRSRIGFNYHPVEKRFEVAIPMKVFEYMAVGLPVVTSSLPELENLLINKKHVFMINSQKPIDFAKPILSLLQNPKEAELLGVSAQKYIQEYLNWENISAPKILSSYFTLLERRRKDGKKINCKC